MTLQSKNNPQVADDEIDLIVMVKTIWEGRKTIIRIIIIFMLLGLTIALFSPKEYSASTTIVPQISNKNSKLGGLSSLAALAGFNLDLNMETSELSPYIYPLIVQSVPFQLEIMEAKFTFSDIDYPVSIYEYYTKYYKPDIISLVKKYTFGLPGLIITTVRGKKEVKQGNVNDKTFQLSQDQEEIRKLIENNVTLVANDKEGYLVLTSRFQEPKLAAEVAQKGEELLQKYIIEFKIKKASAQLAFIEDHYKEKKIDFEHAQTNLASFRDRNKNITSAMAQTELEKFQNEFKLAFDVYSEMAKQLEQARIKVKEETPVFSIVKPVSVPLKKSKPNRPFILFFWTFMGGVVGVGWIFGRQFLAKIKTKWDDELLLQ